MNVCVYIILDVSDLVINFSVKLTDESHFIKPLTAIDLGSLSHRSAFIYMKTVKLLSNQCCVENSSHLPFYHPGRRAVRRYF